MSKNSTRSGRTRSLVSFQPPLTLALVKITPHAPNLTDETRCPNTYLRTIYGTSSTILKPASLQTALLSYLPSHHVRRLRTRTVCPPSCFSLLSLLHSYILKSNALPATGRTTAVSPNSLPKYPLSGELLWISTTTREVRMSLITLYAYH